MLPVVHSDCKAIRETQQPRGVKPEGLLMSKTRLELPTRLTGPSAGLPTSYALIPPYHSVPANSSPLDCSRSAYAASSLSGLTTQPVMGGPLSDGSVASPTIIDVGAGPYDR